MMKFLIKIQSIGNRQHAMLRMVSGPHRSTVLYLQVSGESRRSLVQALEKLNNRRFKAQENREKGREEERSQQPAVWQREAAKKRCAKRGPANQASQELLQVITASLSVCLCLFP